MRRFGELLRDLRRQARLTQEELAERSLLSTRAVSDLERGVNRTARKHTALLLADTLGLTDGERDRFLDAAAGLAAAPTPLVSGLPRPSRSLVGRTHDLRDAAAVLQAGGRLLTLTGPGGVGKTRLALELGHRLAADYADGAAFVSLAGLADADLVPGAVAAALNVSAGGEPAEVALTTHLQDRQLLLVLDNFEHVLAAATVVASLLASASELAVLVTSRTALGLREEVRQPVKPLPAPSAAALFLERATASRPGWEPSPADRTTIATLCLRLDGLPLAIELAAARARLFSAQGLLDRVAENVDLLVDSSPDVAARQRSLRATVTWSLDLLDPPQRSLFCRLAVFRGGFTVGSAERVSGGDVLDALGALLEVNLLTTTEGGDSEPRMEMLETIREVAVEELQRRDDDHSARHAHLAWAADLAARAESQLTGPSQPVWLAVLDAEHDNLRAALAWALSASFVDDAVRLATGMWRYWYLRGQLLSGREWVERVLARSRPRGEGDVVSARARLEYGAGILTWLCGDVAAAATHAAASRDQLSELGDDITSAHVANLIGMIAQYRGQLDAAASSYAEALTIGERLTDPRATAVSCVNLGTLSTERRAFGKATSYLERSLMLFRELGDERSSADVLNSLADLAGRQGRLDQATVLGERSLERFTALADPAGQTEARLNLAGVARRSGRLAEAAEHLRCVLELAAQSGDPWGRASAFTGLAEMAAAARDPEAGTLFRAALTIHRRLEHAQGVTSALLGLAALARDRGDELEATVLEREAAGQPAYGTSRA